MGRKRMVELVGATFYLSDGAEVYVGAHHVNHRHVVNGRILSNATMPTEDFIALMGNISAGTLPTPTPEVRDE